MSTSYRPNRKRSGDYPRILVLLGVVYVLSSGTVVGQAPGSARPSDALHQLNDSIEALVQRVSPSVVQILVTGYGSTEDVDRGQTSTLIGRRRAIGSGVVVDPEGYIVTNAHVVNGAERIEVILPPPTRFRCDSRGGSGHPGKELPSAHRWSRTRD
jgi:S1-C subfamily serine protease